MDAEGLGRKLLLTLFGDPSRAPEKQTVGTVTTSHKMLTLQALSSSLNAGTAKRGRLGRGQAFGCPPAVCPPKRPRPFAHYKEKKKKAQSRKCAINYFWTKNRRGGSGEGLGGQAKLFMLGFSPLFEVFSGPPTSLT